MMKFQAFDLETVKEVKEGEDWKTMRPLGISCAALICDLAIDPTVYYSGFPVEPVGRPMDKEELSMVVDDLWAGMQSGYVPITWNGLMFDFDVLAEESGRFEECKKIALNHIDMMFHFFCVKGYRVGLKAVAKGLGLEGKTEGMGGAFAPLMWNKDENRLKELGCPFSGLPQLEMRKKVVEYVGQDAVTTLEIAEAVMQKGGFQWVSNSGRVNYFDLPKGKPQWLTVKECLELPEPDQSWMTNPVNRSDFYAWMERKP